MSFSDDTQKILEFLDYTTNNNLRKRNDIGAILELSASYNELESLEELLFQATSLWNIYQTIKRNINDSENIAKLKSESFEVAKNIKNILNMIIGDENPEIAERFTKTYQAEGSGAFSNLIDLSHDLAQIKNLVLRMKESKHHENIDNFSESSK